jgi:hypothetical protein
MQQQQALSYLILTLCEGEKNRLSLGMQQQQQALCFLNTDIM